MDADDLELVEVLRGFAGADGTVEAVDAVTMLAKRVEELRSKFVAGEKAWYAQPVITDFRSLAEQLADELDMMLNSHPNMDDEAHAQKVLAEARKKLDE